MRNKIIETINKLKNFKIEEKDFSLYELISSSEIWVTNSISGIIPVTDYRKKHFSNKVAISIINYLNKQISDY